MKKDIEEQFVIETLDEVMIENKDTGSSRFKSLILLLSSSLVISVLVLYYLSLPPKDFPINKEVTIPLGATVQKTAELLKTEGFIKSESLFYLYFVLFEDAKAIKASTYTFSESLNLPKLAIELTQGNYSHGLIKFTHIEGERVEILAARASQVLPDFNEEEFVFKAIPNEGKLFPDTYMIPVTYNEDDFLDLLLKTFTEKIKPFEQEIERHRLSLNEIIILASILEREANSDESMGIVSGILQNRLEINMPLQTDASVEYVLDKPLSELTSEDLKIDSPYNTYLNVGLPPTPIGNPGLRAIEAVLNPTETDYMFYITGNDGNFYYAKTFEEHKQNVEKYLR